MHPTFLKKLGLYIGVLLFCFTILGVETPKMFIPDGNYAKKIGNHSLDDPSGKSHNRQEVLNQVVVAIFSIPNMSQGGKQERWAELLADNSKTKLNDKIALFLIEDMKQSSFRGMARNRMEKEFHPKVRPFLLLDETGKVRERFGVPPNTTAVLIYDKESNLRHVENTPPTLESAQRVKIIAEGLLTK